MPAAKPVSLGRTHPAASASAQEAFVQIADVHKHYGQGDAQVTVLDGISTSMRAGEICVLLGPSVADTLWKQSCGGAGVQERDVIQPARISARMDPCGKTIFPMPASGRSGSY